MKNRKIATLLPVLIVMFGVIIVSAFGVSYSASSGYYYIRRNMLSHHYVKNNMANTASGTILIKTGTRTSTSSGTVKIVYCAEQGANNSSSSHTRKALSSVSTSLVSANAKKKLNAFMQYAYPYATLSEIKEALKDPTIGIGASSYSENHFDNLDAQESMTAVQASIWNAIKGTSKYTYGKTVKKIPSGQRSFKVFKDDPINWESCGGYHLGSGKHATVLNSEETAWYNESKCAKDGNFYKYVFNVKTDGYSGKRINALISWYAGLVNKVLPEAVVPNVTIKGAPYFENAGSTLTLNVTLDSEGKDYSVAFYDQSGTEVLANQKVTGDPNGNTFTIPNLPLTTTSVNAKVTIPGAKKAVYYYQGGGQDWIGVDTTADDTEVTLPILNDGSGKITVYKVSDGSVNVDVKYSAAVRPKVAGDSETDKCANDKCVAGAYFILYASDKETVIKEFVSSKSSFTIDGLPDGTYYLYEQDTPFGYTMYEKNKENVDEDGYIKIEIKDGNMADVTVNNDLIKVCFKKVDKESRQIVEGAKFRLEDAEGSTYEEFVTTAQQGDYCLSEGQIDSGYYYLIEEEAPANYIKSDKKFKFPVGKFDSDDIVDDLTGDDIELLESNKGVVTIENKAGTVITKSDLATGDCVEGAKLVVKDSSGKTVDSWTSSCEEGKDNHAIELKEGKYTLVEELTPSGYATAESIEFTIDSEGKASTSLDMKDAPIEACFLKVSADSDEGLIGAQFEIYKEDGTLYQQFESDFVATCFEYMPVGKYTIRETKAPEGYKKLDEDITVEVKDTGETQVFEIENEMNVPKTAIDYPQVMLIIASIFMIFGLGLVGYYGYKKQA